MEAKKETTPVQPAAPEVNAQGIKIYPTSFVPTKAPLEPSRVPTTQLTNFQIETIHIVIFVAIIFVLFGSMWVNAKTNVDRE